MCNGYFGGSGQQQQCCQCKPRLEKLRFVDEYHWFERCPTDVCLKCHNKVYNCKLICRRNRHIIEALSCLFKCSMQHLLSILFKLVYQQHQQPLKRFSRNRVWSVMRHVIAPYTELNDLEIYDSMYDRCGMPIDPLDHSNILKIVRMLFLLSVLTDDQKQYLVHMLQCLNAHAHCPVHLDLLLNTLEGVELKQLVCSLRNQEKLTQNIYTARQCQDLCRLYNKVTTVDKYAIARQRNRRLQRKHVKNKSVSGDNEDSAAPRQSQLIRQFCERKPRASNDSTPRASTGSNKLRTSQPKITKFSRPGSGGSR